MPGSKYFRYMKSFVKKQCKKVSLSNIACSGMVFCTIANLIYWGIVILNPEAQILSVGSFLITSGTSFAGGMTFSCCLDCCFASCRNRIKIVNESTPMLGETNSDANSASTFAEHSVQALTETPLFSFELFPAHASQTNTASSNAPRQSMTHLILPVSTKPSVFSPSLSPLSDVHESPNTAPEGMLTGFHTLTTIDTFKMHQASTRSAVSSGSSDDVILTSKSTTPKSPRTPKSAISPNFMGTPDSVGTPQQRFSPQLKLSASQRLSSTPHTVGSYQSFSIS